MKTPRQIEHEIYLASPQWRLKRKSVLDRCGYICERCATQLACEVHHLTYENWQNESLAELVGLCRECHRYVEGRKQP